MTSEKQIIEIHGVKMEVDMRHAKRIQELRVGDRVKVLVKVYDGHKVWPGVIIGFEPFKEVPTIIIAYLEMGWNSVDLKFVYFNKNTKDTEVVAAIDDDQLEFSKVDILAAMERKIDEHRGKIAEIEEKRDYFLRKFKQYWAPVAAEKEIEEET